MNSSKIKEVINKTKDFRKGFHRNYITSVILCKLIIDDTDLCCCAEYETDNGEWVQYMEFKKPYIIKLLVTSQNLGMYL